MLTRDDCVAVTHAIADAVDEIPETARAVRVTLKTIGAEYDRAVKMYDRAIEEHLDAEILPVGGIASGDSVMFPAGIGEIRRISETGVERNVDGYWGWENVMSRATPMVAVR